MPRHSVSTLPDGRTVDGLTLDNAAVELRVISYGAIITSLRTRCREGRRANVVLGHSDVATYVSNPHYLGAVVGRYANRIALGRLSVNGAAVQLALNDGPHHLHGGVTGFDRQLWAVAEETTPDRVALSRTSPRGEEHYPGTLTASVAYRLSRENTVEMRYVATTDADTVVNLTQHTYFNLSGDPSSTILDHELTIHADRFTPVDATLIPEGESAPVEGTPFDLRTGRVVGDALLRSHEQLRRGAGFDHNWILKDSDGTLRAAARLRHPPSGRVLDIATTEPGLQFYSGQWLGRGTPPAFRSHAGLCLEPQHFPDSPNRPDFPTTLLRAGQRYESVTTWTFSVD